MGMIKVQFFLKKDKAKTKFSVPAADVKNTYLGKTSKNETTSLLQLLDTHNSFFKRRVLKGERSPGTLEKYNRAREFLSEYISKNHGADDILLNKVDNNFIFELEDYFKFVKINPNTHSGGIGNN
ncbi:MAG: phage integrase SAM-like domain-containing protein [Flavobacteriales bacterium]|nr:phage integrase SAM-like domain-containing protein [Flavobacteriales bacterium]